MIRLRRLFLHDLGRKLLALFLAVLTWWWASGQITETDRLEFTVSLGGAPGVAGRSSLTILKPDGWILTKPAVGDRVVITLRGERAGLARVKAGLGAGYDPRAALAGQVRENPGLDVQTVRLRLDDLDWNNPDAADFVLDQEDEPILLTFERERSVEVDVEPAMLDLRGRVHPNYELVPAEAELSPNRVRLTGPLSRVQALEEALAAWRSGEGDGPGLFEPIDLSGATGDLVLPVRLAPFWADTVGIEPPRLTAHLPIREHMPDPVEFDMPAPQLLFAGIPGTEGWEPSGAPLGRWRLSFDRLPGFRPPTDVDEDWIRDHLVFFVDLRPLVRVSRTEQDLPLHWRYVGEDRPDQMNDSLRIEPLDPANAMVKMKRQTADGG
ncbi:MAG: hypothetical protein D6702_12205 [Planctomycetota bacterium]|nr:MAG: hypothetical protein D6702_12205 [Planctomycetota bacterium]